MGYVKYNLNLTIYGLPLRPNGVGGSILKKAKNMREDPRCKQKPFTFSIGRKKVKNNFEQICKFYNVYIHRNVQKYQFHWSFREKTIIGVFKERIRNKEWYG